MTKNDDMKVCFLLIAEGNKQAFDLFFTKYYSKLVRFAKFYVHSLVVAEDVVADVLTNMLANKMEVFRYDHFEAYLYQSVRNRALNVLNSTKRFSNDDLASLQEEFIGSQTVSNPYEQLVGEELSGLVKKVVSNFPEKRKMVYQLIKEENFSYKKVAELMNISERTVEVHLKLAVKELRETIEKHQNLEHLQRFDYRA